LQRIIFYTFKKITLTEYPNQNHSIHWPQKP